MNQTVKFGSLSVNEAAGLRLFDNLNYIRSFNRTGTGYTGGYPINYEAPSSEYISGAEVLCKAGGGASGVQLLSGPDGTPFMPRVKTTGFDGVMAQSMFELVANGQGDVAASLAVEYEEDSTRARHFTDEGERTDFYLVNARRGTGIVVSDEADGLVDNEGTLTADHGEGYLPGVAINIHIDAAGAVSAEFEDDRDTATFPWGDAEGTNVVAAPVYSLADRALVSVGNVYQARYFDESWTFFALAEMTPFSTLATEIGAIPGMSCCWGEPTEEELRRRRDEAWESLREYYKKVLDDALNDPFPGSALRPLFPLPKAPAPVDPPNPLDPPKKTSILDAPFGMPAPSPKPVGGAGNDGGGLVGDDLKIKRKVGDSGIGRQGVGVVPDDSAPQLPSASAGDVGSPSTPSADPAPPAAPPSEKVPLPLEKEPPPYWHPWEPWPGETGGGGTVIDVFRWGRVSHGGSGGVAQREIGGRRITTFKGGPEFDYKGDGPFRFRFGGGVSGHSEGPPLGRDGPISRGYGGYVKVGIEWNIEPEGWKERKQKQDDGPSRPINPYILWD